MCVFPPAVNCWPSESGSGCDVNIEYELQEDSLELNDVVISIPVPSVPPPPPTGCSTGVPWRPRCSLSSLCSPTRSGVGAPVIGDLDGEYKHDGRRNILEWCLPIIDASNKTGSLEFSVAGQPNDFFPVNVSFVSKRNYCDIQVGWNPHRCVSERNTGEAVVALFWPSPSLHSPASGILALSLLFLTLAHLTAEKNHLFLRIYQELHKNKTFFWRNCKSCVATAPPRGRA